MSVLGRDATRQGRRTLARWAATGQSGTMTRLVDPRTWLEIISPDECWELLAEQDIGRLAVVVEHKPQIFPLNTAVSDHRTIVFRTAEGTKLHALGDVADVAFEVDGVEADDQAGWSVLVSGSARHVRDAELVRGFEQLDLEPWAPGDKIIWVEITPETVSGRRINSPAG